MYRQLCDELTRCAERVRQRDVLRRREALLESELAKKRRLADEARAKLEDEEDDVRRLEKPSFSRLFARVSGRLDEKLDNERAEAEAAQMRYIEIAQHVEALTVALSGVRTQLGQLEDVDRRYAAALEEKARVLLSREDGIAEQLSGLLGQLEQAGAADRELAEALDAGTQALHAIDDALRHFEQAKDWGIVGLPGGGLFVTLAKHGQLDNASLATAQAKTLLVRFQRELSDVQQVSIPSIGLSEFVCGADILLDGCLVDWVVQQRVAQAARSVRDVRAQVANVLEGLSQQRAATASNRQSLYTQYLELVAQG